VVSIQYSLAVFLSFFHHGFKEVQLGPNELGRGEFGVVYQVDALSPKSCECPKCLLKALYDAPENRHKLEAEELNVMGKDDDDVENELLKGSCTNNSTIQRSQNRILQNNNNNRNNNGNNTPDGDNLEQIIKWTDKVARGLEKMFGEEFRLDEIDEEANDANQEGKDNVSDLSPDEDGSWIGANGSMDNYLDINSVRENFDPYRKCYMQRNCIRQGRPRYAIKRLRGDLKEAETKYNAAIDLAVEAKFLAA
jgi:hypothetical protein